MWLTRYPLSNIFVKVLPRKCFRKTLKTSSTILPQTNINNENNSHLVYGQPVHCTHPHIIKEHELAPGIQLTEFQQRRTRFICDIQSNAADFAKQQITLAKQHVVIIPSSTIKYMSDKIPYVFRQNSDFYYLTGCLEPDSALVISINDKNHIKSTLFMRPKDKHAEMWDGARTGVDLSVNFFGVDEAYPMEDFCEILTKYVQLENPYIWYDAGYSDLTRITEELKKVMPFSKIHQQQQFLTPTRIVQEMRLIKSPAEQELMRKTCRIASEAINDVMKDTQVGLSEHHISAMVDYRCRMSNASYLAYPPVVASGENATTIHYINNTQLAKNDELILVDAGCEYGGYTSDITRTWPVNGKFTDPQRILYEVVLQLQKDLIENLLKEGGNTLDDLFETMCLKLAKYLQEIGLVSKHLDGKIDLCRAAYKFCPHHVSHYLGMDVHDTPLMTRTLKLQPGMVCTVEPGIYISKDRLDVPKEFRGLGIRIEDDVLITSDNHVEVLTKCCVKETDDIENLMKS